ncbi:hypothetical protein B296_00056381 [Ensete ventricosum]|uniref:Uncharacterized protein n=1 Tax=Ensete ventricosum TaxID=4639 RepID=A0A426WYK8_ENSVE|nr:hypothetical protein B296_00056381 [Ensete ventricosum]
MVRTVPVLQEVVVGMAAKRWLPEVGRALRSLEGVTLIKSLDMTSLYPSGINTPTIAHTGDRLPNNTHHLDLIFSHLSADLGIRKARRAHTTLTSVVLQEPTEDPNIPPVDPRPEAPSPSVAPDPIESQPSSDDLAHAGRTVPC